MKDLIIVGGGGCGREVADFIEEINKVDRIEFKGFRCSAGYFFFAFG